MKIIRIKELACYIKTRSTLQVSKTLPCLGNSAECNGFDRLFCMYHTFFGMETIQIVSKGVSIMKKKLYVQNVQLALQKPNKKSGKKRKNLRSFYRENDTFDFTAEKFVGTFWVQAKNNHINEIQNSIKMVNF